MSVQLLTRSFFLS